MTSPLMHEKQMQKHIGCMTGFLQIFDRHQILNTKRAVDSNFECETLVESPRLELVKVHTKSVPSPELHSPTPEFYTPAESPVIVLPMLNFKDGATKSSWKFRESPRLSLDSRAIVDAKGSLHPREIRTNTVGILENADDGENQRRSPSVVARLMGLDQLPNDCKAELRRSASESRVSRDFRFIDGNNFNQKHKHIDNARIESNVRPVLDQIMKSEAAKTTQRSGSSPWRSVQQRKSFFDTSDFFPEPKQQSVSIYGEIEKRLRMRGIDEPSRDLETLKQILDALQLKGLLHSKKSFEDQLNSRNFVYERSNHTPIVVTKQSRSPPIRQKRTGNDSPPASSKPRPIPRRNLNISVDFDRNAWNSPRGRSSNSPSRSECSVASSTTNSVARRKALTVETTKRRSDSVEQPRRATSPLHSANVGFRKATPLDHTQSLRNKKPTVSIRPMDKFQMEDESSSISGSSISWSSQNNTERRKTEDYKEGKTLLERCDKLLHSIAEMKYSSELQPSPVSVLDSSFYKDDSSTTPSPIMKRTIDFKDEETDLEDEIWSPAISPIQFKTDDSFDDCDYIYISDILRAYNYYPEDSDIFLLLEKQQYFKGKDTSKISTLQRRLIFDTINEILDRNRQLPPWKIVSITDSSLSLIWLEFRKIREHYKSENLFEVIFGVLKKDLSGDATSGWGEFHLETSEAVLDIERSIFKDLIGETIRDLAVRSRGLSMPCRKLVF